MGRQQYLSRLTLGRSAFAEMEDDDLGSIRDDQYHAGADADESSPAEPYVQQYDAKGRPINPSIDAQNAAIRNAENAALALVGVVKRKDNNDRFTELKFRTLSSVRASVLATENDAGEEMELAVTFLSGFHYATETLIRKVQAGLYQSTDTFASVLKAGVDAIRSAGVGGVFAILFPGAPATVIHATARVLIGATISTAFEYLSLWLIRQELRKKTTRRVRRALSLSCEALLIGLDVFLLPLQYYAYAQRLSLAPTWPLLPNWRILLPSTPANVHSFGWQSPIIIPILGRLCSPAALILLENTLWREQDGEIPVASQITRFEYPAYFNDPTATVFSPRPSSDPLGWILYQGYIARTRLMRFFGYNLQRQVRSTKYENDRLFVSPQTETSPEAHDGDSNSSTTAEPGAHTEHIHRSTQLAHLAPNYLANRLDLAFAKLLFLPLQALVARSVTQSYLTASPLPKTAFALTALPNYYAPFGGSGSWQWGEGVASYLSKLGLSLSLHVAGSASTFFVVYALARWQGRRNFDWGVKGEIGGMVYPTEGEE